MLWLTLSNIVDPLVSTLVEFKLFLDIGNWLVVEGEFLIFEVLEDVHLGAEVDWGLKVAEVAWLREVLGLFHLLSDLWLEDEINTWSLVEGIEVILVEVIFEVVLVRSKAAWSTEGADPLLLLGDFIVELPSVSSLETGVVILVSILFEVDVLGGELTRLLDLFFGPLDVSWMVGWHLLELRWLFLSIGGIPREHWVATVSVFAEFHLGEVWNQVAFIDLIGSLGSFLLEFSLLNWGVIVVGSGSSLLSHSASRIWGLESLLQGWALRSSLYWRVNSSFDWGWTSGLGSSWSTTDEALRVWLSFWVVGASFETRSIGVSLSQQSSAVLRFWQSLSCRRSSRVRVRSVHDRS